MIGILWSVRVLVRFFASFFSDLFKKSQKGKMALCSFAPVRFPLYNLMKICESVINRFQSFAALFSLIDDTKVRAF